MLLVLANVGLLAWFLSSGKPSVARVAPVVEGEAAASISLVSEVDPEELVPAQAQPQVPANQKSGAERSPAGAQPAASDALCTLVGPFEEEYQGEDVAQRLRALQMEASLREIEMQGQMRYWVYLAPLNSSQEAFRKLRELQAAGVDSYVIPKGSLENGISFGIFSEIERAQVLTKELQDRGFAAEFREEPQTYLERWVVLGALGGAEDDGGVSPESVADDFWEQLQLDYPDIGRRQNLCSEIRSGAEE
ncbi:SPOR domain-containing protein [Microbulbifer elongatus]|uniref:SPOR domain-containing protein n=1 Tax=Microbulbifer elongatus TaxID=86173 RepID=UPI001CFCBD8C|nr:hypothetical protein [Microbulbifer elongatus]